MSAAAILALREAIVSRLAADAALAGLMGGAVRLHDEPPRGANGIYAAFGEVVGRDWSTGSDRGTEQRLSIHVWSRPGGAKPALAVAARIAALLDDAALVPLGGHRLVNLRVEAAETTRDKASGLVRVALRLRAVSEQS